jgi:hypothetical protein
MGEVPNYLPYHVPGCLLVIPPYRLYFGTPQLGVSRSLNEPAYPLIWLIVCGQLYGYVSPNVGLSSAKEESPFRDILPEHFSFVR